MKCRLIAEHSLNKCYSIAPLRMGGGDHILVAAEKDDPCYLFDLDGKKEGLVWDPPGGTMTMVAVPGHEKDGWFLATRQFYSPNDGDRARLVLLRPLGDHWEEQVLLHIPYVHRFGILERGGCYYLIACTVKTSIKMKEDWSTPGKIYVAELPPDIEAYTEERQLPMTLLRDGLFRNHGYTTVHTEEGDYALVGSDAGVHRVIPPEERGGDWQVEELIGDASSDMVLCDFDGDGIEELLTISPFHGDHVQIYRKSEGRYQRVWDCPFLMEMAHAIWSRDFYGKKGAIIGCRKGSRDLVFFSYEDGAYQTEILVRDAGSANIYPYDFEGRIRLVSANRERDQIAFYELEE